MVATASILTLLVAGVASLFMAWVIGAGSSGATPFAPAVGANAISVLRAGFVVGLLGLAGAVVQGGNVTQAVGSELVHGVTLTPTAVIVALVTAAGLMAVGIVTGYPIATAFTVTGAIIGAGLALGGDPAWAKYRQVGALWLLAPVADAAVAYAIASTLPRDDVPERVTVPLLGGIVGAILANVQFAFLGAGGVSRSLAASVAASTAAPVVARVVVTLGVAGAGALLVLREVRIDEERALRRLLLALGSLVAFSAGGSQVGLAVGPLVPLLDDLAVSTEMLLLGGGLGLLVGSWTGAPRMIKSISMDYSSLGPRRSIAALLPSFAVAQLAVFYGVPVSFNEIIVSAIVGSGLAVGGSAGVSRRKLLVTVGGWAGSFVLAFGIGYVSLALVGG